LSRETVWWPKVWLEHAGISEGAVFRRLIGTDIVGRHLNPRSVAPIFKRVAQWIGKPARYVRHVSGHSTRVGATQDLAAVDIELVWRRRQRKVGGIQRLTIFGKGDIHPATSTEVLRKHGISREYERPP
jgi:hypothetical protein